MSMEKMSTGRVENVEKARDAAKAEKPFRDAARERDVSPEEKSTLDRVAERKGEEVISGVGAEKERKTFVGRETVNGVSITVKWDENSDDYVVYLPQIERDKVAGVMDQVLHITSKPDIAKLVFDYACQLAKKEPDVYKMYQRLKAFSKDWQCDDEE